MKEPLSGPSWLHITFSPPLPWLLDVDHTMLSLAIITLCMYSLCHHSKGLCIYATGVLVNGGGGQAKEEPECTDVFGFAATIFVLLTTATLYTQHYPSPQPSKASDPINAEDDTRTLEECPLRPFCAQGQARPPSRRPRPMRPPADPHLSGSLLVIRRGRICGLAAATAAECKAEMHRWDWAGRDPRLINPSVLVVCGLWWRTPPRPARIGLCANNVKHVGAGLLVFMSFPARCLRSTIFYQRWNHPLEPFLAQVPVPQPPARIGSMGGCSGGF